MSDLIVGESGYDLPKLLDEALAVGNYKEALLLVDKSQNKEYFEDGSTWDLIPIVSKYVNRDTFDNCPDVFRCCEVLLAEFANRAHTEEALLEFIELVECSESNISFTALLKPMQMCLKRKVQRANFLLYCLNAIESYVTQQSVPDAILSQESRNEEVADTDPECTEVTELYVASRKFYEPFLWEIAAKMKMPESLDITQTLDERKNLMCFLLQLLGKPLASFNMSHNNPKTDARIVAENIVLDLTSLCGNLLMFLEYAEGRQMQEYKKSVERPPLGEDFFDIFLLENKVSTFSIGVLFYLIFGEDVTLDRVPCVYNNLYILQISLYLSTKLLEESDCHIIEKGLKLADKALVRVEDDEIPCRMLELPTNEKILQVLAFTIIYSSFTDLRQLALKVFKQFIQKLDPQGKYLLMCNIHRDINHDGLLGVLIDELKGLIDRGMSSRQSSFCGKSLFPLLKLYCTLPDVKDKNLLEVSSQVAASLNLFRFFIIKDKKNITGIWDFLDYFENTLFEPLRAAIDIYRENNKAELKRILNEENQTVKSSMAIKEKDCRMSVTVGGKEISTPLNEEVTAQQIHDTLNILDMLASLLFRLKECIQYSLPKQLDA